MKKTFSYILLTTLTLSYFSIASAVSLDEHVSNVYKQLPDSLNKIVKNNVKFTISELNKTEINFCETVPAKTKYATYTKFFNRIKVSKSLINSFNRCPEKLASVIEKTIAHELFHAYDSKAPITKNTEMDCLTSVEAYKQNKRISHICKKFNSNNNRRYAISSDLVFKVVAQIHGKTDDNFKGNRTIDPYEFKNDIEFSAVNFEGFIFDSEYQCRRPSLYRYFSRHFNYMPNAATNCDSTNTIISTGEIKRNYELDINKVYQVHYLHASEGEAAMSSFGHSMIRLVMCAPGRDLGPDCLKDINHHIVLSYRANVADINTDSIKGIKGDYPSQLFVMPLKSAIEEYNIREMRDLYSYPINFSRNEIKNFLLRTLETYWEYVGSYKFFTNNCASETYKLIVGTDFSLKNKLYSSMTPNAILEDMMKAGKIDKKYKQTKSLGRLNIFRSNFRYIDMSYKRLFNKSTSKAKILDLIKENPTFLENTIESHASLLTEDLSQLNKAQLRAKHLKNFSAIYLIQKMILDIQIQNLKLSSQEIMINDIESGEITGITIDDIKAKLLSVEASGLVGAYGIPTNTELDKILNSKKDIAGKQSLQIQIQGYIQSKIQGQIDAIKKTYKNVERINQLITIIKKHN